MKVISRLEIEAILAECLRNLAPEEAPEKWDPQDKVLRHWGLDSQHGIELACELEDRLGINIPLKDNPLVDDSKTRKWSRTFEEVIDYLEGLAS